MGIKSSYSSVKLDRRFIVFENKDKLLCCKQSTNIWGTWDGNGWKMCIGKKKKII